MCNSEKLWKSKLFFLKFDSKIYLVAERDLNSHGAMHFPTWCEQSYTSLQKYDHAWQRQRPRVSLHGSHAVSGISTRPNRSEGYEFQNKSGPKSLKEELVDLCKINHIRYSICISQAFVILYRIYNCVIATHCSYYSVLQYLPSPFLFE